ncbi:hypothetical protein RGC64_06695 [Helicobacter pylori]|nr:hypothetical protein [Helicobacter pylori]MDU9774772.1 hypothetical protein [Helicobacter pylori]
MIIRARETPNDTIMSKVYNGTNFSNVATITQNLNDTNKTTQTIRS